MIDHKSFNVWQSYGEKVDCFKRLVCRDTVLQKDEEFVCDLMYGRQELLKQHDVTINTPR